LAQGLLCFRWAVCHWEAMAALGILFASGLAAAASAVELTPENWDAQTAGKTVFIKFQAPW